MQRSARYVTCDRNQVFVLTPPGPAAIAVVRMVGPGVIAFLSGHFSKEPRVGRCVHGNLSDGDRMIDDPVVVLLPHDSGADVNLHGGPWVVRSFLDLAASSGFEVVEAVKGVLPLEAFDDESLIELEIAASLPLARTELALRVLLAQAEAWKHVVLDAPQVAEKTLADKSLWHLLHPPTVAIIGAANVGKSTLANQLFGQERSITADLPGTTRDWVGEIANIDGLAVMLVDTPGMRTTDDAIEQAAIARSRSRIEESELVVLVLDVTRPLEPEQGGLLRAYPNALRVLNKCDQPWNDRFKMSAVRELAVESHSATDADPPKEPASGEQLSFAPIGSKFPSCNLMHTVAITGDGIMQLRRAIAHFFGCTDLLPSKARWWTVRQSTVLGETIR